MTAGLLCLQGGRELTHACRPMDAEVVRRAAADASGPIVSLAGAARRGGDYAGASARVVRHYGPLAAEHDVEVVIAPDPREDLRGSLEALETACLVVLPGGSPASLRSILQGPVGERVVALNRDGTALSGSSAGAMVLCQRMILPSQGRREVDGLGLAPGLAHVHWSPPVPGTGGPPVGGGIRWGLPEQGGVMLDDAGAIAVGHGVPSIGLDGIWRHLPRDRPMRPPTS